MSAADRLAEIEARANAATEGPWRWTDELRQRLVAGDSELIRCAPLLHPERTDATFIARARTDVPALAAALRTVLALHRPRTVKCVPAECYDACPHEEQGVLCPDVEVTVCAECWDVAECSYPYFAETGGWDHIVYPCPTVRAIEGALQ